MLIRRAIPAAIEGATDLIKENAKVPYYSLMKYHCFTLMFIFLITFRSLNAQDLSIGGVVVDSESKTLPYASVTIFDVESGREPKANKFTDESGKYRFDGLSEGKYILTAAFLGYQETTSDTIVLTGEKKVLGYDFRLKAQINNLDEVTITAKPPIIESANGKLVINLQNSTVTSGQTGLDLLRRLPGISVDQNDNILFRGAAGVNVMVDGKMTYLSGNQLSTFLQGLNAEDIGKIELITTPPSEMDAAGNTGIINIIRKKKARTGYAIDVRSVVSKAKYWMVNENISASIATPKISIYGSFDFNTPHKYSLNRSGNTIYDGEKRYQLSRSNESIYKINYYTWRLNTDWQLLPNHKLSFSYHGYFDDFKSERYSTVNTSESTGALQSRIRSSNNIIEPYHFDAFNLHYDFDLDSTGKKLSADAFYTSYRNFSDAVMQTDHFNSENSYVNSNSLISHQPGFVRIKSVKADAEIPLKPLSIKAGVKFSEVENDNQYHFDSLYSGNLIPIPEMSNHFIYKEQIGAVYVSASKRLNKTAITTGLRLESTDAKGNTVKNDISNHWNYTQLFPSLSIEQEIDGDNKADFSISRRINRPSYTNLNPVRWYLDPYFYFSGNPNVVPELAWVYSINYSFRTKYIFSFIYNESKNYINRKLTYDDNGVTIKSLSANFGIMRRLNFTASIPVQVTPWWNIQFFGDVNYTTYPISVKDGEKQVSQLAFSGSIQQEFSLPKGIKATSNTHYYSAELRGIYRTLPYYFTDFGINKTFLKDNLKCQLTVNDVFNTTRYKANSLTDIIDYNYDEKPFSRRISLSLSYHLGGKSLKPSNRRSEEQDRL